MTVALKAEARDIKNSPKAGRLRREGKIPAVIYSRGQKTEHYTVDEFSLLRILKDGEHVVELQAGSKKKIAVIADVQRDFLQKKIYNLALHEVHKGQTTIVTVPLVIEGKAIGLKEGGVMNQVLREIDVECTVESVPEQIVADVSGLGVGDHMKVSDLTPPSGVKFVAEFLEREIAMVHVPRQEKEPEPVVAAEAEGVAEGSESVAEGADAKATDGENKDDKAAS